MIIFSGFELFTNPTRWNPVRQIPYVIANGAFFIGMGYMYVAELFIALPLHAVLQSQRIRSVWSYAFAGAMTGAVAVFTMIIILRMGGRQGFGQTLLLCIVAGLFGGAIFWRLAVRPATDVRQSGGEAGRRL